jgi:hypothetical protein
MKPERIPIIYHPDDFKKRWAWFCYWEPGGTGWITPRQYGVAYIDYGQYRALKMLIPFNIIVAGCYLFYWFVRFPFQKTWYWIQRKEKKL